MALNIDGIRNAFENGDFARPNLFEVEIPFLGRNFKFKCKGASIPPGLVEAVIVSYQNRKVKVAGDRTYEEWTLTVYLDTDHETRQQFIDWQAQAAALGKEIYGEIPEAYKKNGLVRQYDRQGEETAVYNIYGCFPTNVGEVQMNWDTNNEVATFEVTLAFDYWTSGDGINA
ncbi:tail tube [Vibrio phage EniLVp02]